MKIIEARSKLKYEGMAGAWLVLKDGTKLLVTRRSPQTQEAVGKWNWVGGGVDEGETPRQAAIREFQEEAGADLSQYADEMKWFASIGNPLLGGNCHFFLLDKPKELELKFNEESDKDGWVELTSLLANPTKLNWPTLASLGPLSALMLGVE